MRMHKAAGHYDPRFVHRKLLMEDGGKLNRCKGDRGTPQKACGFLMFKRDRETAEEGPAGQPKAKRARPECNKW